MYGYKLGYNVFNGANSKQSILLNSEYLNLKNSVLADGGEIDSQSDLNSYITMAKVNGIYDSIQFGMLGAYNIRTSGNTKYVTKAYSMDATPRDATQTTELAQPYLSGFIAPNEKWGLKNPNGEFRYMTHSTISFAANEVWSISALLNLNGDTNDSYIFGNNGLGGLRFNYTNGTLTFVNELVGTVTFSSITNYLGKNILMSLIANGIGDISLYINGNLFETKSISTVFSTNLILRGRVTSGLKGTLSTYIIRNQALTPTQVEAEATKLRQIFPEIPSVQIGTQRWATSNCEMVATPQGNVIPEVTDSATWADSQNIYDTTYAATVGTDAEKEQAALKASAMWCYYNNDPSLGAIYGKLYNWFAVKLLQNDIDSYNIANPSTTWGWHVPSSNEFSTLETYLGGDSIAGGKIKVAGEDYWFAPNTGAINSSGLSIIGSGQRLGGTGVFQLLKARAYIYSADDIDATITKFIRVFYNNETSQNLFIVKIDGCSLRLIKD